MITGYNLRDLRVLVLVDIIIVLDTYIMITVNILALIILVLIILALVKILLTMLNIDILGIITMKLILHNPHRHITLMLNPLANHLSLPDQTNIHTIIFMKTIYMIYLLSQG